MIVLYITTTKKKVNVCPRLPQQVQTVAEVNQAFLVDKEKERERETERKIERETEGKIERGRERLRERKREKRKIEEERIKESQV